jgi:uncharacterized protein YbaR (Trm112 family)
MQADPKQKNLEAVNGLEDRLACPACLGALHPEGDQMVCAGCCRAYPVTDGIPVLIVERAKMPGTVS